MNAIAIKSSLPATLRKQWAAAAERWRRLAPREQRLLATASVVVGGALVFLILIEPAWTQYRRLQAQLPALRTQAATVDALTREARTLRRTTSGKMSPAETRQALADTLRQAGIEGKIEDAPADPAPVEGALQVSVDEVSAAGLMQWLESVPARTRLKLAEVALERPTDANGRLMTGKASGELLFVPAQSSEAAR